jgi:hypothetical protein
MPASRQALALMQEEEAGGGGAATDAGPVLVHPATSSAATIPTFVALTPVQGTAHDADRFASRAYRRRHR